MSLPPQLEPQDDQVRFREALGCFATGVTVITTADADRVHGMTANGFMSVSLDPLLVLVSIAKSTRMHGLLADTGSYGVSVLGQTHESLSQHFAGRPLDDLEVPFRTVESVPLIEGAIAQVAARVVDAHPAGDHTLFIGEVLHFDWRDGAPLIFHSGGYRELVDTKSHSSFSGVWSDFSLEPMDPLASD